MFVHDVLTEGTREDRTVNALPRTSSSNKFSVYYKDTTCVLISKSTSVLDTLFSYDCAFALP